MTKLNTPGFSNPPINEVVFGVGFKNSPIKAVDFGLYYNQVKDKFPKYSDQPPVLLIPPVAQDQFLLPRVWFEGSDATRLMQFQQDKFYYNWRQFPPSPVAYPHFKTLLPEFESLFGSLESWWKNSLGKNPEVKGLELTYINHIDAKSNWDGPRDNHKVFKILDFGYLDQKFAQTEAFFSATFYRQDFDSDIFLSVRHGQRIQDGSHLAVYEITVRERNRGNTSLKDWFILAHNSIIDLFIATTTDEAQKIWGRANENTNH